MTEAEIRSILKSYDQDGRDKSELDAKLAHFFNQQKTSKKVDNSKQDKVGDAKSRDSQPTTSQQKMQGKSSEPKNSSL